VASSILCPSTDLAAEHSTPVYHTVTEPFINFVISAHLYVRKCPNYVRDVIETRHGMSKLK
jgi:hypothetical protein